MLQAERQHQPRAWAWEVLRDSLVKPVLNSWSLRDTEGKWPGGLREMLANVPAEDTLALPAVSSQSGHQL